MSYDIDFAKKIKKMSEIQKSEGYMIGIVEQVSPLVVSCMDGELMASGKKLFLTDTVRALLDTQSADKLACGEQILMFGRNTFVAVDRVWKQ